MNRLDRLQAILIHLQSKKVVTAQEIADRFGISIRTVYRDIRSLEEAGVPVGAEAGMGYFLADNFHLPPVMFTCREASALLLGAKLMEHHADKVAAGDYDSALFKIKAVLRGEEKERIDTLHRYVDVWRPGVDQRSCDLFLHDIQQALVEDRKLIIRYTASYSGQTADRTIAPLSLCHYGSHWHLIAHCELRGEYRDFRLDRILSLLVSSESFIRSNYCTAAEYFAQLNIHDESNRIIISMSAEAADRMHDYKFMYGFTHQSQVAGCIEMHFYNNDFDGFARWLLYCGHKIVVIQPEALHHRVIKLVQQLKEWYLG